MKKPDYAKVEEEPVFTMLSVSRSSEANDE